MKRHLILSIGALLPAALLLGLYGCSSEPEKKEEKKAEAPVEPVTAQKAFYGVFPQARLWSGDIEVLNKGPMDPEGVPKGEPGTAGAWQVTFVSPSKQKMRQFTYSVVKTSSLDKGAAMGLELPYSPKSQEKSFRTQAFKIDSPVAYKTAMTKAVEYSKKNPDMRVTFQLEGNKQFPNPAWRVIWGDSVATSNFSIYVDATTGEFLKTMH